MAIVGSMQRGITVRFALRLKALIEEREARCIGAPRWQSRYPITKVTN